MVRWCIKLKEKGVDAVFPVCQTITLVLSSASSSRNEALNGTQFYQINANVFPSFLLHVSLLRNFQVQPFSIVDEASRSLHVSGSTATFKLEISLPVKGAFRFKFKTRQVEDDASIQRLHVSCLISISIVIKNLSRDWCLSGFAKMLVDAENCISCRDSFAFFFHSLHF